MKWVPGLSGKKQISELGPSTAVPLPRREGSRRPHPEPQGLGVDKGRGPGLSLALPLYSQPDSGHMGPSCRPVGSHLLPR